MWFSQNYLSVESDQNVESKWESVDCVVKNGKMWSATFDIRTLCRFDLHNNKQISLKNWWTSYQHRILGVLVLLKTTEIGPPRTPLRSSRRSFRPPISSDKRTTAREGSWSACQGSDLQSRYWWTSRYTEWTLKSNTPVTSVDISAMNADFCMKFYKSVKQ